MVIQTESSLTKSVKIQLNTYVQPQLVQFPSTTRSASKYLWHNLMEQAVQVNFVVLFDVGVDQSNAVHQRVARGEPVAAGKHRPLVSSRSATVTPFVGGVLAQRWGVRKHHGRSRTGAVKS